MMMVMMIDDDHDTPTIGGDRRALYNKVPPTNTEP
jgi:hypothetical protein